MSRCDIHHAAYDLDIVGVRPDGVAEVRGDMLEDVYGPMLWAVGSVETTLQTWLLTTGSED